MDSVKALPLISAALNQVNTARPRFVANYLSLFTGVALPAQARKRRKTGKYARLTINHQLIACHSPLRAHAFKRLRLRRLPAASLLFSISVRAASCCSLIWYTPESLRRQARPNRNKLNDFLRPCVQTECE
jgi:hypothetical protein